MKGYSSLYSNYSGGYTSSPLHGHSQPYQEHYSVYSKMMKKDIKNGVYTPSSGGYSKNPTAKRLDSIYDGKQIIGAKGQMTIPYVITSEGNVIIGRRNGFGRGPGTKPTPHPTLVGGQDPKVKMAGMLTIKDGKILSYDNMSGHFRPNNKSMKWADKAFEKYPKHKDFKGGKKHE